VWVVISKQAREYFIRRPLTQIIYRWPSPVKVTSTQGPELTLSWYVISQGDCRKGNTRFVRLHPWQGNRVTSVVRRTSPSLIITSWWWVLARLGFRVQASNVSIAHHRELMMMSSSIGVLHFERWTSREGSTPLLLQNSDFRIYKIHVHHRQAVMRSVPLPV